MTYWQRTRDELDDGLPDYAALAARGSPEWHRARRLLLARAFELKLLRFSKEGDLVVKKGAWLTTKYAKDVASGVVEQAVAEEARQIHERLQPLAMPSFAVLLDEYPAALEAAGVGHLLAAVREFGQQTGYMLDLWNRSRSPHVLELLGVDDLRSQVQRRDKRDAAASFLAFFVVVGNALVGQQLRRLGAEELAKLVEDAL